MSTEIILKNAQNNENVRNEIDFAGTDRTHDDINDESSHSSNEETFGKRLKRRIKRFSDSDECEVQTVIETGSVIMKSPTPDFYENDHSDKSNTGISTQKSRLRTISDSGSDSDGKAQEAPNGTRIGNKKNKLKQKFQSLFSTRRKDKERANDTENLESETSDDENEDVATSITKLKEKIREKTMTLKSSLYDPDTSDEESNIDNKNARKGARKMTKSTSPKPMRMSAKQAMENMQKIKSESNRMLREKEVSLPYHRPKALSLKDILSRRRPAVSSDGKVLPIKMNEQQLKQYVQHLEQRQKEVIELCKSESEEEEVQDNDNEDKVASQNDTLFDDMSKSIANSSSGDCELNNEGDVNLNEHNKTDNEKLDDSNHLVQQDINENCDSNVEKSPVVDVHIAKESKVLPDDKCQTDSLQNNANSSGEMELLYNDSIEEKTNIVTVTDTDVVQKPTETDSELLVLHYDTEKTEINSEAMIAESSCTEIQLNNKNVEPNIYINVKDKDNTKESCKDNGNMFSDDDMNMDDIDALIEKAEIIANQTENVDSPMLIKDKLLNLKPKITGVPGMVINLDGTDPLLPRKLTGMDLLKERFAYFSKLKTPEEMKREREKIIKPGTQHLKLKQELEEQIAEQRSLEWAKRLEAEKRHQQANEAIIGNGSDAEEDIEKIEAKLEETDDYVENESSSGTDEEDIEEMDVEIKDKPRKRNPMVDDEAVESDGDETGDFQEMVAGNEEEFENETAEADDEQDESDDESTDESEESDTEQEKPRKGRILKAFQDSDDEETSNKVMEPTKELSVTDENIDRLDKDEIKDTQDDELQLAQVPKSLSEELFTSQESHTKLIDDDKATLNNSTETNNDKEVNTQTFSILESTTDTNSLSKCDKVIAEKHYYDDNLDDAVALCSGRFSQTQNILTPTQTQAEGASQLIGDDVLALCTGKFYDNKFVSQVNSQYDEINLDKLNTPIIEAALVLPENSEFITLNEEINIQISNSMPENVNNTNSDEEKNATENQEDQNLKSILDELNDPKFDAPKAYKYFVGNDAQQNENKLKTGNAPIKKKFVIESDDEDCQKVATNDRKRKNKRKKLENRALLISDDEEEQSEIEEYASEKENDEERLVEYDDEENEILVQPQNPNPKKKRKIAEFFENEAELTSEDEWIGSGDEDERGLDRMEREDGDDDTFNQNQLQRELGQIHMRDVLDKDKREVRLIQELLFEDGDLGEGHRQRKFRWRDADGEDGTGIPFGDLTDTQEEEFESEEQWRKQRHEREMFLKTLQEQEGAESTLNVTVSRTSLIKANLTKNSTSIFTEINCNSTIESPVPEKKTNKDIPSPKKPFAIFQQNYHGSLLTRGRGALARLAALATPLAADDDAPRLGSLAPSSKRNFVFAALDTVQENETKIIKRKADNNLGTPRLVKKMKTEEKKPKQSKSNLLDHLKLL